MSEIKVVTGTVREDGKVAYVDSKGEVTWGTTSDKPPKFSISHSWAGDICTIEYPFGGGSVSFDASKMTAAVTVFMQKYGYKQFLNDKLAKKEVATVADCIATQKEYIEALQSGTTSVKRAGSSKEASVKLSDLESTFLGMVQKGECTSAVVFGFYAAKSIPLSGDVKQLFLDAEKEFLSAGEVETEENNEQ